MIHAWRGKYLEIDLTKGASARKSIPIDILKKTIGGVGLAAQLIYDHLPTDFQALGP